MICPQTKQECGHFEKWGFLSPCKKIGGCLARNSPPPPTMAEIERLVDALEDAGKYVGQRKAARAALMAAIRAHGRE